jgi:hypothetical protein
MNERNFGSLRIHHKTQPCAGPENHGAQQRDLDEHVSGLWNLIRGIHFEG